MTAQLVRLGHEVNAKRVRRLMRLMGLEAVYQKPRLTQRNPEHKVYPNLLRDVTVERPDHPAGHHCRRCTMIATKPQRSQARNT